MSDVNDEKTSSLCSDISYTEEDEMVIFDSEVGDKINKIALKQRTMYGSIELNIMKARGIFNDNGDCITELFCVLATSEYQNATAQEWRSLFDNLDIAIHELKCIPANEAQCGIQLYQFVLSNDIILDAAKKKLSEITETIHKHSSDLCSSIDIIPDHKLLSSGVSGSASSLSV